MDKDFTIDLSKLSPSVRQKVCTAIMDSVGKEWGEMNIDLKHWDAARKNTGEESKCPAYVEMEGWRDACRDVHLRATQIRRERE